ncbi:hypothetical protein JI664_15625 [Rhodobacter sp. NTK016B]|nr:hypothetical protein [Rhodobacter sp. NTK016B]
MPFAQLPIAARRHVYVFQGHQFLDRFAMGAIVTVTALALDGWGLGVGEIGTLFAVCAAVTMMAELPFGGLADGVGRKPVFLIATVASLSTLFDPLSDRERAGAVDCHEEIELALCGLRFGIRHCLSDQWRDKAHSMWENPIGSRLTR